MKFRDTLRLSLHNMWNNKTMTLLVIIVMLILSILVTTILGIALEMIKVSNYSINMGDNRLDLTVKRYSADRGDCPLEQGDIDIINKIYDENRHLFGSIFYENTWGMDIMLEGTGGGRIFYTDPDTNFLDGDRAKLIDGRAWNADDVGKNYVWISKEMAERGHLQCNTVIDMMVNIHDDMGIGGEGNKFTYTIKGIYDISRYAYNCNFDFLFLYTDMTKLGGKLSGITIEGSPYIENSVSDIMKVSDIAKEYNEMAGDNRYGRYVYSGMADNTKMTILMNTVIVGASIFFILIIILLSIGCISNAIQITVEQNRKFFGMMKAIGMRNKHVKSVVRWQAVIMILIAVIIATAISAPIISAVGPIILEKLMIPEGALNFGMPFYVPFIIFAMQVLLVMLYTNKSLNKISRMDVISVISEVD